MYSKTLSLDQALNLTGFAIYQEKQLILYGTFSLKDIKGDNSLEEKISNVKKFLTRLISEYEIEFVVLEDIQKQVNVSTFKNLSWLQGVLINFLYENQIPHLILNPSEWRKIVGVKGRKREEQKLNAQKKVQELFSIEAKEDEADAIMLGLASLHASKSIKEKIINDFL